MGRLVLNVLLSFAQFEREIISERTRDKIAATRRKGKWSGGLPLLGYDVDRTVPRLVVNPKEAVRVRAIFDLYLKHQGLLPVVRELERRGWRTKAWVTCKGRKLGGRAFTKTNLHQLLINPTYAGKLRYKTEIHQGEHPAIVDPLKWQKVQQLLHGNHHGSSRVPRHGSVSILKGLLHCRPCGCAMTPTHATKGGKRYRYYVCSGVLRQGRECPSRSVPAGPMERIVLEQISKLGQDPERLKAILAEGSKQRRAGLAALEGSRRGLEQELARAKALLQNLLQESERGDSKQSSASELEALRENIGHMERRLVENEKEALTLPLELDQAALALEDLEHQFGSQPIAEQARLIRLMVQRVDYDGAQGKLALTVDPAGVVAAVADQIQPNEETDP